MALNNLTDQNIQDTFQKVVQTDGTNLADGTGSLLPISFEGNNVIISGSLIATDYIVSSSVSNITIASLSGSTKFGNSQDDTHQFTGSLFLTHDVELLGDIKTNAGFQIGPIGESLASTTANLSINGNIFTQTHITASGNISSSGELIGTINGGTF